jgi:DNA/RNA-binding domain of Phe-tRNA-synthetase-like protein
MEFKIVDKIFEKYPELDVGVLVCKGIDNSKDSENVQKILRKVEEQKRKEIDSEKILEIPSILKWREVYKSFGAKPSKYRNSAEALLRRVVGGNDIYKINSLVDIYNLVSLKYICTVGGEDLDKLKGDLVLDFADGKEEFIALGSDENHSPKEGEVVYKDNRGVICRRWNWRESDRTKLTEDTKNAIIVIENLIPEEDENFKNALSELKTLIENYCGGNCELNILNKENKEFEIK